MDEEALFLLTNLHMSKYCANFAASNSLTHITMKTKEEMIVKALKKGNREAEMELLGPGFHSMNQVHKSPKDYTRKQKHKGAEIEE